MHLDDFDFYLPIDSIATHPAKERTHSRLMVLPKHSAKISHQVFHEIIGLVDEGDLLVFNNTKVFPARLFGKRESGGKVELLVERVLSTNLFKAQVKASKSLKIGETLYCEQHAIKVLDREERFYLLQLDTQEENLFNVLQKIGQVPLPPYIKRLPDVSDQERYQTVYASQLGSVAAPTAGFHFDENLLQKLKEKNIDFGFLTLHIGAGTFLPVRDDRIENHVMHSELISVSAKLCEQIKKTKANNKRVIAVGTTSLRALESASKSGEINPYEGDTSIFIYPGYQFNCVDVLITNFHLPRSSLFMLVCAFGGHQQLLAAYQTAIREKYRFYSYGDAMWIEQNLAN